MMDVLAFVHDLTATRMNLRARSGDQEHASDSLQRPAARLEAIMTMSPRDRIARLIATLAVTSAMLASAMALPRAAFAEDGQLDKMRAKIAAFIGDKMEK